MVATVATNKSECFDDFIMKANAVSQQPVNQTHAKVNKQYEEFNKRFIDTVRTKDMDRLLSEKNQEAYLNELKVMNTCPDCIKAISDASHVCARHGHHH